MDVANVQLWVDTIEAALRARLGPCRHVRAANAAAYRTELDAPTPRSAQIETIPPERRQAGDRLRFIWSFRRRIRRGSHRHGHPALSTLASPSARQLAALQDQLAQQDAAAVFVGTTVNPQVAERLAGHLGIRGAGLHGVVTRRRPGGQLCGPDALRRASAGRCVGRRMSPVATEEDYTDAAESGVRYW
ncbi:MAG: zinc ABC transporter substrate-binding protein [Caldilineaceae bacterium]